MSTIAAALPKLTELKISLKTWHNHDNPLATSYASHMLVPRSPTRLQCCLGIAATACGVPDAKLDEAEPTGSMYLSSSIFAYPFKPTDDFVEATGWKLRYAFMMINDAPLVSDRTRDWLLSLDLHGALGLESSLKSELRLGSKATDNLGNRKQCIAHLFKLIGVNVTYVD